MAHKEVLQEVMLQICELVQRDTFTQSLHTLGILNTGAISTHSEESQGMKKSSSFSIPKQQHEYKVCKLIFLFRFERLYFCIDILKTHL